MPTQLLPVGMPWTMLANQVYALPVVEVTMYTDAATPTLTVSMTQAFTLNTAVTVTTGQATLTGGFVKATANTPIILKRD